MRIKYLSSLARNYTRTRMPAAMAYSCRVERVTKPTIGVDLKATPGARTTVYEGPFRLWEITGATSLNLGGEDIMMESTQASFPHDAPLFRKDDEIVITACPPADAKLTGQRFQIQTKAKAGELRATRRYTVTAVQR